MSFLLDVVVVLEGARKIALMVITQKEMCTCRNREKQIITLSMTETKP